MKTKFIAFNDGLLDCFATDDEGERITETKHTHHFKNKTVGYKRFYSAKQNDYEIDRVVAVHQNRSFDIHNEIVINDISYKIIQIQHIDDSKPKTTVLTLTRFKSI